jgi:hypothetical protein
MTLTLKTLIKRATSDSDDRLHCLDLEKKIPTRDAVPLMRRNAAQLLTMFPEIKLGVFQYVP